MFVKKVQPGSIAKRADMKEGLVHEIDPTTARSTTWSNDFTRTFHSME